MKTLRSTLTWLVLIGQAVYVAVVWSSLPAMLPSHFGFDGVANRYAPKSIVWLITGISALMIVATGIVRHFPKAFNLPKPVGDPERPRLEAIADELILWIRLEIACVFAYIAWSIVQVGLHRSAGLGSGFAVISVVTVMLTVIYFVWRLNVPQTKPAI